ncbi:pseudouridine synthase [Flavihumibacter cheonanensis]|uniref:pseudouridine synthase n=1 Tax=Flavihumibacter cheonanensis TaxID=1442385 RepID=UPI001EF7D14F|nr:pseudouridine synthase [Flavihumibacter cheonanensis]MCG7754683.1 pseudouridine synthase [Flavihumibacter cheonanensis]
MLFYFVLYKPYEVLSQFSSEGDKKTLKDICSVPTDVYPVGRLDYDSEGLLLLTNDRTMNAALLQPAKGHSRTYLVQVEGAITSQALQQLQHGVEISVNGTTYLTRPAKVRLLEKEPVVPERNPPIRYRKNIPTSWIELTLTEGKNRQVRKMTAKTGFPTLRLIRYRIGNLSADGWESGELRTYSKKELTALVFA